MNARVFNGTRRADGYTAFTEIAGACHSHNTGLSRPSAQTRTRMDQMVLASLPAVLNGQEPVGAVA
jgi:hypothetical protein